MNNFCLEILFYIIFFAYESNGQCVHLILQPDSASGKDVNVWSIMPNNNYGFEPDIIPEAWTWSSAPGVGRSLIQFDLTSIPSGAFIQSATLTLYNDPNSTEAFANGEHVHISGSNQGSLMRITGAWTENTVTWNTQPATTLLHKVTLPEDTNPHEDYILDVAQLVQDMVNNPSTSFGFMLRLDTEQYYRAFVFASSDNPNAVLHPKLEICYTMLECTLISLQPDSTAGKDVNVWSIMPNNNYGFEPDIIPEAWTWSSTPGVGRSLIQFDLTSIPTGAIIQTATLTLYNDPNSTEAFANGEHVHISGSNQGSLMRITGAWAENTATWNTQPTTTLLHKVTLLEDTNPHEDYILDVAQLVQDMVDSPSTSFGFMLRLDTEQYYRAFVFASSDNPNAALHPKIEICYRIPLSIPENSNYNTFLVYPNPSSGSFTISLNEQFKIQNAELKIMDSSGRIIREQRIRNQKSEISNLSHGFYFIQIQNAEGVIIQKVIVQ